MEKRQINSIGMFDTMKGFMMLAIILGHSFSDFIHPWEIGAAGGIFSVVGGCLFGVFGMGLMPCFFMVCGYGVRRMAVKKMARQQVRFMLKPYLLVALAMTAGDVVKKLLLHTDILTGLRYQALPYLLGFCPGQREFLGLYMDSIGPIWFFVAFALGSVLLSAVLQIDGFWCQCAAIALMGGFALSISEVTLPWCIQQTMICTGYMFAGYQMKRQKFFANQYPLWLMAAAMAASMVIGVRGGFFDIAGNMWPAGSLPVTYVSGAMFMYAFYRFRLPEGVVNSFVGWCGRNALYICCLHTVAYTLVPWDKFAERFASMWPAAMLIEIAAHCAFAFGGALLIEKYLMWKRMH